jgi:hypothetical protein
MIVQPKCIRGGKGTYLLRRSKSHMSIIVISVSTKIEGSKEYLLPANLRPRSKKVTRSFDYKSCVALVFDKSADLFAYSQRQCRQPLPSKKWPGHHRIRTMICIKLNITYILKDNQIYINE